VNVACSTLCFARYPLERALRMIGELEFIKLDVAIHEDGPHLKPSEVAADVALAGVRIRIGPSLTPGAFSVKIAAEEPAEYERQLRAICRLARLSTVSTITIPAGPNNSGLDTEVKRLTPLVKLAEIEGIVLTVATHVG
jgi:sugar phosphate isomerase/epimerase